MAPAVRWDLVMKPTAGLPAIMSAKYSATWVETSISGADGWIT